MDKHNFGLSSTVHKIDQEKNRLARPKYLFKGPTFPKLICCFQLQYIEMALNLPLFVVYTKLIRKKTTGKTKNLFKGPIFPKWICRFQLQYIEMALNLLLFVETIIMMTSSNGNIYRVTGHLCGEFTGPRWIPHTKASDAELWCFLWSASE